MGPIIMKLVKSQIIEAAELFNKAKNFAEFKVLLDLAQIQLEDFERDYFEIAQQHPVFAKFIGKLGERFDSKSYMRLKPSKIYDPKVTTNRFILPCWFKKDEFGDISMVLPNNRVISISYSEEFAEDMRKFGIDPELELVNSLMYELVRG